jgi:hypothetical protein
MIPTCTKTFVVFNSVKIAQSVQQTCVKMTIAFTVMKSTAPITASKELLVTTTLASAVKLKRDVPAPQLETHASTTPTVRVQMVHTLVTTLRISAMSYNVVKNIMKTQNAKQ